MSGAENGAERPENRVERSGAVSGRCRKTMERSGARSGNGVGSGGYRIRLERGAAFSPAPLRSHALVSWMQLLMECSVKVVPAGNAVAEQQPTLSQLSMQMNQMQLSPPPQPPPPPPPPVRAITLTYCTKIFVNLITVYSIFSHPRVT